MSGKEIIQVKKKEKKNVIRKNEKENDILLNWINDSFTIHQSPAHPSSTCEEWERKKEYWIFPKKN